MCVHQQYIPLARYNEIQASVNASSSLNGISLNFALFYLAHYGTSIRAPGIVLLVEGKNINLH